MWWIYKESAERLSQSQGWRERLRTSADLKRAAKILESANEILTEEEKVQILRVSGGVPGDLPLTVSYKLLEFQSRLSREISSWLGSMDDNSLQDLLSVLHRDLANNRERAVKSTSISIPHSLMLQSLNIIALAASAYMAFGFQPEILDTLPFGILPEAFRENYPPLIKTLGVGVVAAYGNLIYRTLKRSRKVKNYSEAITHVSADLYEEVFKVLATDANAWTGITSTGQADYKSLNPRDLIRVLQEEYESYLDTEPAPTPRLQCSSILTSN